MLFGWLIGIAISLVGNITSSIGPNLQKYAFTKTEYTNYLKNPYWWCGQILVMMGTITDFIALYFASPSIIAPTAAFILPCNFLIAHYKFNEELHKNDIYSTLLIVFGSILSVSFGDHTETNYSLDQLSDFWDNPVFITYFCIICLACCNIFVQIKRTTDKSESNNRYCLLLCSISGICSGLSFLIGKSVLELLKVSFLGNNQLIYFGSWLYIFMLVVSITIQQYFYNQALKIYNAMFAVPIFQCFLIGTTSISSVVFFHEYTQYELVQWVMFPLGILIIILGASWLCHTQILKKTYQTNYNMILDNTQLSKINPGNSEMNKITIDQNEMLDTTNNNNKSDRYGSYDYNYSVYDNDGIYIDPEDII
jgi:uncharacterized membrane protein